MDWIFVLIAIISGALASLFYFLGLWLTLRKMFRYKKAYWMILISLVIRLGFILLVFYAMVMYHWGYMIIALASFLVIRQIIISKLGGPEEVLYS